MLCAAGIKVTVGLSVKWFRLKTGGISTTFFDQQLPGRETLAIALTGDQWEVELSHK